MDCKLKCCPFCGSDAFDWYCTFDGKNKAASGTHKFCGMPTDHHLIECKRCGIRTKVYATKKSAFNAWNRRMEDGKSIHSATQKADEKPKV